jgi:hypothetical protein
MSKPDPRLGPCARVVSNSKIKVEANKRKAIFDNSDRVEIKIVDVDCWLETEATLKADYIVCKPDLVDVVVELKGKDIDHAVEQIVATVARWKEVPPCSKKIGGLIVFTRSPERSAAIDDIKKRLLKNHGLWLEMNKNNQAEYRFETFTGTKA